MTHQADAQHRPKHRFTYKMKCPTCGWVGAVIPNLRTVLEPEPTGTWKCLNSKCGVSYEADVAEELDKVPDSQMGGHANRL